MALNLSCQFNSGQILSCLQVRNPIPSEVIMFWSTQFSGGSTDSFVYNFHFLQLCPLHNLFLSIIPTPHHPPRANLQNSRPTCGFPHRQKSFIRLKEVSLGSVPNPPTAKQRRHLPMNFLLSFCICFEETQLGNTLNLW